MVSSARTCDMCSANALYVSETYDVALCGHHYRALPAEAQESVGHRWSQIGQNESNAPVCDNTFQRPGYSAAESMYDVPDSPEVPEVPEAHILDMESALIAETDAYLKACARQWRFYDASTIAGFEKLLQENSDS